MTKDVHRPPAFCRFQLTASDVLACERLPGEWPFRQKVALLLPLLMICVAAGFFSDRSGLWWWSVLGATALLWVSLCLAALHWNRLRRSRLRAAREGRTEVEETADRLLVRSEAGTTELRYDEIGRVIIGEHHVFVLHRGGAVILPQRAFDSIDEMRLFGETVDARSMAASP